MLRIDFRVESADFSAFFGNVEKIAGTSPGDPLEISVPVGKVALEDDSQTGVFLLFKLDLAAFRHKTETIGLVGCSCLGLFTVFIIGGFVAAVGHGVDLEETTREMHEAFAKVGKVLWDAPMPYALLDSDDRVKDCNRSLCELFSFEKKEDLLEKEFRSLVWPEDQLAYDHVEEQRRKNRPVDSYSLRFLARDGKAVQRWIVSASVPSPAEEQQNALPETFGIMLAESPATRLQVVERPRANQSS